MTSLDIPATSGIYRITCSVNGRFYIGSAINLQSRWRVHLHHLRHNTHGNQHLQRAWDKHGEQAFIFAVIEYVLPPFLLEREQYWFDKLQPFDEIGFNLDRVAGSRYGSTPSAATREKLRLANLGRKDSKETILKRAESGRGRIQSEATREKVRLIRLGTKRDEETRERLRLSHLGQKQSAETIEKRRLSQLGRPVSEATRAKISASNAAYTGRMTTLIIISPDGVEHVVHGVSQFCREHNLNRSALRTVALGKANHHKGWKARFPENE